MWNCRSINGVDTHFCRFVPEVRHFVANVIRLACWATILIALILALHECNGDLARIMTL